MRNEILAAFLIVIDLDHGKGPVGQRGQDLPSMGMDPLTGENVFDLGCDSGCALIGRGKT